MPPASKDPGPIELIIDAKALSIMADNAMFILLPAHLDYLRAQQVRVLASLLAYMDQMGVRPNFTIDLNSLKPAEGTVTDDDTDDQD